MMWTNIQYALLYPLVKAIAFLPMPLLYGLANLLYLLTYRVVRYRLRIVRRNMAGCFPDKPVAELRQLERDFYHHFADYIVETIKLAHISLDELLRRGHLNNPELIDQLMDEGHTCVVGVMGHYGNWEWFSGAGRALSDGILRQIYRPLTNKAFDRLFISLRNRKGACGIRKNDTIRDMIRLKKERNRSLVVFIADQTPSVANLHYWTSFMGQNTPMLTGPERIARKLDLPVVFIDTQKTARGHYTVDFKIITKEPKATPEFWITEQYARMMEDNILRNPAYWLWTHKRWKHKHLFTPPTPNEPPKD